MSNKNTVSHDYMSDNRHFADAINYFVYDGRQVIHPEDLVEQDVIEEIIIKKLDDIVTSQKIRDVAKRASIKSNGQATFAIIGIENQSEIHYAMPVRNMVYDALNYASQVAKRVRELRINNEKLSGAEFLSGFRKDDRLYPVITIVINWSDKKWDGPLRLKDMMPEMDQELSNVVEDYGIKLIDPHDISSFEKFHTMLGDVLEFIKRQDEEDYLRNMVKEKGDNWILDIDSVCAINTFVGVNIPIEDRKEDKVSMCRAVASLIEEGMEKGIEKGELQKLVKQVARKMSKGKTIDEIVGDLEEDYDEVSDIYNIAAKYAPDYNVDEIVKEIHEKMTLDQVVNTN